ncbi:hypothetical protein Q5M85_03195 [Paraclostridium bifermentans]|nr:hypothetical protein [Paraclostridium bifermentans]
MRSNRLDADNPSDVVYTKDLFTLEESPRLGCWNNGDERN